MTTAGQPVVRAIGTAVPDLEVHRAFVEWAGKRVADPRRRALFLRMTERSGIDRRWSMLPAAPGGGSPVESGGFYAVDPLPSTGERMDAYAALAPALALRAVAALSAQAPLDGVTHLVVASCTGFMAPGIDQVVAEALQLDPGVERTVIGFMGCYAGITALKTARHIVRSEPDARVLAIAVELSSLHLTPTDAVEELLAMLQFGDGAAAALVTGDGQTGDGPGLTLGAPASLTLASRADLIRWRIGDAGFVMHLSGAVPEALRTALADPATRDALIGQGWPPELYAIHPGGRSILDAVAGGLGLNDRALDASRAVLRAYGNMSSATILFVLAEMLARRERGDGLAMAFGPGLAVETIRFTAWA